MNDTNFKYWVAGFIAGEGYFGYGTYKKGVNSGKNWAQLSITLNKNDSNILYEIQKILEGTIYLQNSRDAIRFCIQKRSSLLKLIKFCDTYMYDCNKNKQYIEWKKKILESNYLKDKDIHTKNN